MSEDVQARIAALEGQVADLVARTLQPQPVHQATTVPSQQAGVPFWDGVLMTPVTLTTGAGEDWDALIDAARAAATTWVRFEEETRSGRFDVTQEASAITVDAIKTRLKIAWFSKTSHTVPIRLSGSLASGATFYAQVKFNGVVSEYTFALGAYYQAITLNVMGNQVNHLTITFREDVDEFYLMGRLWHADSGYWVDPTKPENNSNYQVN